MTGVAVAADAAGERFALDFQLAAGSWRREPLSSCRETRFEEVLPVIWQLLADDHGVTIAYPTLRTYVTSRRGPSRSPGACGASGDSPR